MIEFISQVFITLLSGTCVWLISTKRYRIGFLCGVLSSPFWLYSSITKDQWGIVFISLWYAYHYTVGYLNHR